VTQNLESVSIQKILPDELFRVSFHPDPHPIQGVKEFGIVQPLFLHAEGEEYRIVCGFRRLQTARTAGATAVPAMVCRGYDRKQTVLLGFLERLSHGPLNDVERARGIEKFTLNGWSREELAQSLFPLLGIKFNQLVVQQLSALLTLPEEIQLRVARGQIYLYTAHRLCAWTPHENQIGEWFISLKLGANKQRELLDLMEEVTRICSIEKLELIKELERVRSRENPLHVYDAWQDWLNARRFPRLTEVQRQFEDNKARFRLPGQIQLTAPAYFEENRYKISFPFQSREELERYSRKLLEIAGMPELEAILKLI
jgi:hypothetical protein